MGLCFGAALLGGNEKAGSILVLFLRGGGWGVGGVERLKKGGGGEVADGGGTEVV